MLKRVAGGAPFFILLLLLLAAAPWGSASAAPLTGYLSNASEPPAGTTRVASSDGMIQVYVPSGKFLMGAEQGATLDARPAHTAYLDGFWIDQTEVTYAMFAGCVEAGKCAPPFVSYYSDPVYKNHAVMMATWEQAGSYCRYAGRRLPTEAEWEKAARGTDGRSYPWGEGKSCDRALYSGCDSDGHNLPGKPVGSYPAGASPYGALDMAGNMAEWVADSYDAGYYTASPSTNPSGPQTGVWKVVRGLGNNYGSNLHSASRSAMKFYTPSLNVGFRCAQSDQAAVDMTGDICSIEEKLFDLGYTEVGLPDCQSDDQTAIALRHFQWANQLPITGKPDAVTASTLQSPAAEPAYSPPPFPARIINRFVKPWDYQSTRLAARMQNLGYLSADTLDYHNQSFREIYEKATAAFRRMNGLPAGNTIDFTAWETLFSPLALAANSQSTTANVYLEPAEWATRIYPLAGNPEALASDGKTLWVATSNGGGYDDNLLQIIDPEEPFYGRSAPIHTGHPDSSKNRIDGLAYAGGKIWVYTADSGDDNRAARLSSFLPDSKLLVAAKELKCANQPCFPSNAFGSDGRTLWVAVRNDLFRVNPVTAAVEKTLHPGWLASGSILMVNNCLWMSGESGYVAVSTDGRACPGGVNAYTIPSGSPAAFDGKWIWFGDPANGAVNAFDPATGGIIASVPTRSSPSALAFDGTRIWTADSGNNTVRAFDPRSGSMGKTLKVGDQPSLLLFDGKRLWVANAGSKTVQWLDTAGYVIPPAAPFPTAAQPPASTPTTRAASATAPPPTLTPTPPALTRDLFLTTPCMQGEDVRRLQLRLAELGYTEVGAADGDFGNLTDKAVRRFQQDRGLVVDGIVGQLSWKELFHPVQP